jgi:hypothetical protein
MKNIIAAVILGVSIIAAAVIHGRVAPPPSDVDAQLETVCAVVENLQWYVTTLWGGPLNDATAPGGTTGDEWHEIRQPSADVDAKLECIRANTERSLL